MRDYTGLLEQFTKYADHYTLAGRKPSESDIDVFIKRFFTRSVFTMEDDGVYDASKTYRGAKYKNYKTGGQIFSMADGKTTQEYTDEIRPLLIETFKKEHGDYGLPLDQFNPKPFVPANETQRIQYDGIKSFMIAYNAKTLPFRLRKTMHMPLRFRIWGQHMAEPKFSHAGLDLVMRSEADIQEFMLTKKFRTFPVGGRHAGIKQLLFMHNPDGLNPKFGIIDLDNQANLPTDKYNKVVYDVAREVIKVHPETIVQFTGRSFQIWFGLGDKTFEDAEDLRYYIKDLVGGITKHVSSNKELVMLKGLVHLDLLVNKKNHTTEMFFGQHYKTKLDDSTGLIKVPVAINRIKKFDPSVEAHPSHVYQNFESLKAPVDKWFTSVGIGEGYSDLEAAPGCFRTPNGHPDKSHPLVAQLEQWKKSPTWKSVKMREIGEEVLQHPELFVMPKYDGWSSIISYRRQGGFKVNGVSLDVTKKQGKRTSTNQQRCIISSKGGLVFWDNHITREFESLCESQGVDELTVVAELLIRNSFGVIEGPQAVTSILNTIGETGTPWSKHNEVQMRELKAMVIDVITMEGVDFRNKPLTKRLERIVDMDGSKVSVVDVRVINDDHEALVKSLWDRETMQNENEGLVIYGGGRRYKIKRNYTVDAVVMGVLTDTKAWQDRKKKVGSLLLGISKERSFGRIYVPIGKVGNFTDEIGKELFDSLLGKPTRETYGYYENILEHELLTEKFPGMKILKPESWVVVEVEYEVLSSGHDVRGPTMLLKQSKRSGKPWVTEVAPNQYHTYGLSSPKFLRLRPDKDPFNPYDVRPSQAPGLGFDVKVRKNPPEFEDPFAISKQEPGNSENAVKPVRTHVLNNPYYGWNAGPRLVAASRFDSNLIDLSEPPYNVENGIKFGSGTEHPGTPIGHKPMLATSRDDKYLTLRKEFPNQLENTKLLGTGDDWGLHYDPEKMRYPKNKSGVDYFLDIPGFEVGTEDGVFDIEGPNLGGAAHDKKREEPYYYDQLTLDYQIDREQLERDNQIAATVNMLNFQDIDKELEARTEDDYDEEFYVTQNSKIGQRLGRKQTGSKAHDEMRRDTLAAMGIGARNNPTEETISEKIAPKSEGGFIEPFDIFMVYDGGGDE